MLFSHGGTRGGHGFFHSGLVRRNHVHVAFHNHGEIILPNEQDKRFMLIVYVREPVAAEEAGRLKNFLEAETGFPVTLNVQIDSDNAANLVSGNGIIW